VYGRRLVGVGVDVEDVRERHRQGFVPPGLESVTRLTGFDAGVCRDGTYASYRASL
jgi:hypothetical protein